MSNPLPQIYIIRGPFAQYPSERAYELNRQTGARIYFSGLYFIRPDGEFGFNPDESRKATEFLLRRVENYLASGLGKPLIIDGVTGSRADELVELGLAAGWTVVVGEKTYIPEK